jgi:hypothetical protein
MVGGTREPVGRGPSAARTRSERSESVEEPSKTSTPIPLGQRLFERPFLLLLLGLVVMFGFYTIWGLIEVMSLPEAPLP